MVKDPTHHLVLFLAKKDQQGRILRSLMGLIGGKQSVLFRGDGIAQRKRSRFPPSRPGFDSRRRLVSGWLNK